MFAVRTTGLAWLGGLVFAAVMAGSGCGLIPSNDQSQKERDEKTREEVARATEKAKPALQEAGRQLEHAAKTAVEEAHAAAQGVKEGWERGGRRPVDLNAATESELLALPGITRHDARKIIAARPYKDKYELVIKNVLPEDRYAKIRDDVTVK